MREKTVWWWRQNSAGLAGSQSYGEERYQLRRFKQGGTWSNVGLSRSRIDDWDVWWLHWDHEELRNLGVGDRPKTKHVSAWIHFFGGYCVQVECAVTFFQINWIEIFFLNFQSSQLEPTLLKIVLTRLRIRTTSLPMRPIVIAQLKSATQKRCGNRTEKQTPLNASPLLDLNWSQNEISKNIITSHVLSYFQIHFLLISSMNLWERYKYYQFSSIILNWLTEWHVFYAANCVHIGYLRRQPIKFHCTGMRTNTRDALPLSD